MTRLRLLIATIAVVATPLVIIPSASAAGSICTAVRDGDVVELSWDATDGKDIIRRDGNWLSTPGFGSTSYIDGAAPDGASYEIRSWVGGERVDTPCVDGGEPPADEPCTGTRSGSTVVLSWFGDDRTIVRRDGDWRATLDGETSYRDSSSPVGSAYSLRRWVAGVRTDVPCNVSDQEPPTPSEAAERVVHVSIDGLRVDVVTPGNIPALVELRDEGASTLNARSDYQATKTLPNHTSQFTGRPMYGTIRHRVTFNSDNGGTVHDAAGEYVGSVFDVVHDNGGDTALFAGKDKFQFLQRSWADSIDDYVKSSPAGLVDDALAQLRSTDGPGFTFFHIRLPDSAGHAHGWSSPQYLDAVHESNDILEALVDGIRSDPALDDSTAIIVTADHGGPEFGMLHDDFLNPENYVVPFVVWGPGVRAGADLYQLNSGVRANPGNERVDNYGIQPIRTHEVANLALDLLGLPAVPGSVFNADQSLRVR